ncbi:hypothetical protein MBLNU457_1491t1 [Dothideomycetes sp. NU457]
MALSTITTTTVFTSPLPVLTTTISGARTLVTPFTTVTNTSTSIVTTTLNASSLLSALPPVGWTPLCVNKLIQASYAPFVGETGVHGLVDGQGNPMQFFNQNTWGINYTTCQNHCDSIGSDSFNFESFAGDLTNYLLPWLALCAQLPYEADDGYSNIMSFFLAVGSPMLTTFSLFVAMLDRQLARSRFKKLRRKYEDIIERHDSIKKRIKGAEYLLREAGHVSIRASNLNHWLTSLASLDQNTHWWTRLHESLKSSRREVTPSLVAQICVAILAYALTVIATYVSDHGEPAVTLQVTAGSLWLWLVPVIVGWIMVGTQKAKDSISKPLESEKAYHINHPTVKKKQTGIVARSGVVNGLDSINDSDYSPKLWGFSIQGDERRTGPIYCYARLFTWSQAQRSIIGAFKRTLEELKNQPEGPSSSRDRPSVTLGSPSTPNLPGSTTPQMYRDISPMEPVGDSTPTETVRGDSLNLTFSFGQGRRGRSPAETVNASTSNEAASAPSTRIKVVKNRPAYRPWGRIDSQIYTHLVSGIFMAFIVQWGTTGPAVMLAYKTWTPGLGCRSGSYLIYGGCATVVFILMLTSMLLSHQAMLMFETEYRGEPPRTTRGQSPRDTTAGGGYEMQDLNTLESDEEFIGGQEDTGVQEQGSDQQTEPFITQRQRTHSVGQASISRRRVRMRSKKYHAICAAAIILRKSGKVLAVANAMWLIISSLLEFASGFNNCYCQSTYIELRSRAFVTLFPNARDLEKMSFLVAGMATLTSAVICLGSIFVFLLSTYY